MPRRSLQVVNLLLAIATIWLGAMSMMLGTDSPVYGSATIPDIPALDSNLRFMGGLGVGLGLALVWLTPNIERHTTVFRVAWICAFLGGIGRLISAWVAGLPPVPMIVFTAIEVPAVPVLIYWQSRVSQAAVRQNG